MRGGGKREAGFIPYRGDCRVFFPSAPHPLGLSLSKAIRPSYPPRMAFFAYILRCNDGSYYTGHTEDLEIRMAQHQTGALGGYTAKRLPVVLLWSQDFATRDEAFDAERQIKGWSRAKKEALIAGDWSRVTELARNRQH